MKNFCSLSMNGLISECIADSNVNRKTCGFYKKSSHRDDCMHYVMDSFCDCVKAQICETNIEDNNKILIEENNDIILEERRRLLFHDQY